MHSAWKVALSIAVVRTMRPQSSCASSVGSTVRAPAARAAPMTAAMCSAWSWRMCTKLTEFAFCREPRWNRFG
ncbi:hypothetical protein ASF17_14490, partial [Frigoribacterium sp. Leaf263]